MIAPEAVSVQPKSVGKVISFGDGVVRVKGLDDIQASELVDLGNNQYGLALNLEKIKPVLLPW